MPVIDLNADLGEGFGRWELGDDDAMLDVVTSANVACGFHAGDPRSLANTLHAAGTRSVVVGAHPAYRDLAGFGRRYVDASPAELRADVIYQIGALQALARASDTAVRYVKPHGALYNTITHDRAHAGAVVDAVADLDLDLPVLGPAGSVFLELARDAGLRVYAEAFADRAYTPDGRLVSRREPGSLLHDPEEVAARIVRLVHTGTLQAVDGSVIALEADSICVHGDSPGAVGTARAVRRALEAAGIDVRPFVTGPGIS